MKYNFLPKCLVVCLAICLVPTSVRAENYIDTENKSEVMLEKASAMFDEDVVSEMRNALAIDEDLVQLSDSTYRFDELKELEMISNTSKCQLMEYFDYTDEEADQIVEKIVDIREKDVNEIGEELSISTCEAELIKEAVQEKNSYTKYKDIADDERVTLSSQIASSELEFTQLVISQADMGLVNGKYQKINSKYSVTLSFKWKKCYYTWDMRFDEKIAVAWSGGFSFTTQKKEAKYYVVLGVYPAYTWGRYVSTGTVANSGTPSAGCVYSMDQETFNLCPAYLKEGQIRLYLTHDGYSNKKAQLISQYCHKRIGFSGVTISATPSITCASGYDITDSDNTTAALDY